MKGWLLRWKWVLLYTSILYLSLDVAGRVLEWLRDRDLSGLIGIALVLSGLALAILILRRMRKLEGRLPPSALLRFLLFLAVYLFCAIKATSVTVERVHFVEYGFLAVLCLQALKERYTPPRRMVYAVVATFVIGFVDEVIQGILPSRYYDNGDVLLNALAGVLPVAGMFWLPLVPARKTSTSSRRGDTWKPWLHPRVSDTFVLALVLAVAAAMLWIGRVVWDPELLVGRWERKNRCGTYEWMVIQEDGGITWADAEGNRAVGWYEVGGDKLDGKQLRVDVILGSGDSPCAWRTGTQRNTYFERIGDRIVFKKRTILPYKKVDPQGTSDTPPSR